MSVPLPQINAPCAEMGQAHRSNLVSEEAKRFMRRPMRCLAAGLLALASFTGLAEASVTALDDSEPRKEGVVSFTAGGSELKDIGEINYSADELTQVAINRIIRVGPRPSVKRPDRCEVIVNGDIYYSEALTEEVARERLAAITNKYARCWRKRDYMFR